MTNFGYSRVFHLEVIFCTMDRFDNGQFFRGLLGPFGVGVGGFVMWGGWWSSDICFGVIFALTFWTY